MTEPLIFVTVRAAVWSIAGRPVADADEAFAVMTADPERFAAEFKRLLAAGRSAVFQTAKTALGGDCDAEV